MVDAFGQHPTRIAVSSFSSRYPWPTMMTQNTRTKPLIYVVDDDDGVRDSLSILIESAEFQVQAFEPATAALARCQAHRPACVLTDVRMPGMDGLEFQSKL